MYRADSELVGKAVTCIEKKLREPITLDSLSDDVNVSKFHMLRLFKALTGQTPMDYARARKLTESLNELLNSRLKIIDIAIEYAFEYEQTYIRAFKGLFNTTPSAYRRKPTEIPVVPKYDLSFVHNLSQGILLEPYFCMKPEFFVTGIKSEIIHEENVKDLTANKIALDFYEQFMPQIKDKVYESVYIGLVKYSARPEYSNFYIPSVEVSSFQNVSEPFLCLSMPMNTYAVFKYIGFHSFMEINIRTLMEVYNCIDFEWAPKTSYVLAGDYHFERIDSKVCSESYCEAEIFMPIKI